MWDREAAAAAANDWIGRYVRAWETNDPDDIRSLFTENAEYRDGPSTEPWIGHDAILAGWLGQKDDPGTWSFAHELTADREVHVLREVAGALGELERIELGNDDADYVAGMIEHRAAGIAALDRH